jgi:DNA-nicking Smr family endonuclease
MEIDLHGYHPREIVFNGTLAKIVQQAWEMGESELTLIHGHGRKSRNQSRVCEYEYWIFWPVHSPSSP